MQKRALKVAEWLKGNEHLKGIQLEWSFEYGLKVTVNELREEMKPLLAHLGSHVQHVRINDSKTLSEILKKDLPYFSHVSRVELSFAPSQAILKQMPQCFTQAKRFGCPRSTFNFAENQPQFSWEKIEALDLLGEIERTEMDVARTYLREHFPNFKVCF